MNKEHVRKTKELEIKTLELSIEWKKHELEKLQEDVRDYDYYR